MKTRKTVTTFVVLSSVLLIGPGLLNPIPSCGGTSWPPPSLPYGTDTFGLLYVDFNDDGEYTEDERTNDVLVGAKFEHFVTWFCASEVEGYEDADGRLNDYHCRIAWGPEWPCYAHEHARYPETVINEVNYPFVDVVPPYPISLDGHTAGIWCIEDFENHPDLYLSRDSNGEQNIYIYGIVFHNDVHTYFFAPNADIYLNKLPGNLYDLKTTTNNWGYYEFTCEGDVSPGDTVRVKTVYQIDGVQYTIVSNPFPIPTYGPVNRDTCILKPLERY